MKTIMLFEQSFKTKKVNNSLVVKDRSMNLSRWRLIIIHVNGKLKLGLNMC